MIKKFFRQLSLYGFLLLLPSFAFAQVEGDWFQIVFEIVNKFIIWFAVLVAVIASVVVFVNAQRMHGGVFSKVLRYFGFGMLFVLGGFVALALLPNDDFVLLARDLSFMLGYVLMVVGSMKLLRAIKN